MRLISAVSGVRVPPPPLCISWEKQTGSLFPGVPAGLDPVSRKALMSLVRYPEDFRPE